MATCLLVNSCETVIYVKRDGDLPHAIGQKLATKREMYLHRPDYNLCGDRKRGLLSPQRYPPTPIDCVIPAGYEVTFSKEKRRYAVNGYEIGLIGELDFGAHRYPVFFDLGTVEGSRQAKMQKFDRYFSVAR